MPEAGDELAAWVGFSQVDGIGPARMRLLREHFGQLTRAWQAPAPDLVAAGLDGRLAQSVVEQRPRVNAEVILARAARADIRLLTLADADYPMRLAEIDDPPAILYVRGTLVPDDAWCVAIVGTRQITRYGTEVTIRITQDLVQQGITIVSGLARGVDTCAHQAALQANGRTIAVLGSGVDVIYPPENHALAARIVQHGALLSEHPPGTKPDAPHFPRRNRIVSGLSLGTVVTEAGLGSGALITARLALEQNREVFAVPGRIHDRASEGANALIRDAGAKLITETNHVLDELSLMRVPQQLALTQDTPDDPTEATVLRCLSLDARHIDDVTRAVDLPAAAVGAALAMLELRGLVRHVGAMNYVRAR